MSLASRLELIPITVEDMDCEETQTNAVAGKSIMPPYQLGQLKLGRFLLTVERDVRCFREAFTITRFM